MSKWWNWQTRTIQVRVAKAIEGSSPFFDITPLEKILKSWKGLGDSKYNLSWTFIWGFVGYDAELLRL